MTWARARPKQLRKWQGLWRRPDAYAGAKGRGAREAWLRGAAVSERAKAAAQTCVAASFDLT
eukprot:1640519-Alexandrium_andersonii.AAC.1